MWHLPQINRTQSPCFVPVFAPPAHLLHPGAPRASVPAKAVIREYNVLFVYRPSEQEDGHEDPGVIRNRDHVITGRRKR